METINLLLMGGPEAESAKDANRLLTNKTVLVQVCYKLIICYGHTWRIITSFAYYVGLIAEKGFGPSSDVGS